MAGKVSISQEDLGMEDAEPSDYSVIGGAIRTAEGGVLVFSYTHPVYREALEKVEGNFLNVRAVANRQIGEEEDVVGGLHPSEVNAIRTQISREEDKLDSLRSNAMYPTPEPSHIDVRTIYDHEYPGLGRMVRKLAIVFIPFGDLDEEKASNLISDTITEITWGLQDAVPRTMEVAKSFADASSEMDPYERNIGYALAKNSPKADALFVGQDGQICTVKHNKPFLQHRGPYAVVGRTFEVKAIAPKLKKYYPGDGVPSDSNAATMAIQILKETFGDEFKYANLGMAFVHPDRIERIQNLQKYGKGTKADPAPGIRER